jgi:4-diphosphocytidyl-2-C-methyl-D-erythritol kinase
MLRLKARAKINWSLDILTKRDDGYHTMDMLMSSVELADELTFDEADVLTLTIVGNDALTSADNLVLKAAATLVRETGCAHGAAITLTKRVPVGAGMGGGSADAAAALLGLNCLWGTELSQERLLAIGLTLGADVPFTLTGGLARVGGIGEAITPLFPPPSWPLVIVQPCQALWTREVFAAYDVLPAIRHPSTGAAQAALLASDLPAFAVNAGNVLQQVVEGARPQIPEAVAALEACGATYASMTGSGSAVYGVFTRDTDAQAAYRLLHKRWRRCWLTRTCERGVTEI